MVGGGWCDSGGWSSCCVIEVERLIFVLFVCSRWLVAAGVIVADGHRAVYTYIKVERLIFVLFVCLRWFAAAGVTMAEGHRASDGGQVSLVTLT